MQRMSQKSKSTATVLQDGLKRAVFVKDEHSTLNFYLPSVTEDSGCI